MKTMTVRPITPSSSSDLDAERTRAVRALLARPLLVSKQAEREDWLAVLRQQGWLRPWFSQRTDWVLRVDARAGYARLEKRIAWDVSDASRGAVLASANFRPMSRRGYVLLCLIAAELVATNLRQVLVRDLATSVAELTAAEGFEAYEATRRVERQALVDALRLLQDLGVLHLDDGSADAYLDDGDALYSVDADLLGSLVIERGLPGGAPNFAVLGREPEPLSEDAMRARQRQHLARRLLDDPAVYEADLEPEVAAHLHGQSGRGLAQTAEQAGLQVERRSEGMAAIDAEGDLTDLKFPNVGTVAHAALLVCELLSERAQVIGKAEILRRSALEDLVGDLLNAHRDEWAAKYIEARDPVTQLTDEVVDRLVAFRLVRETDGGGILPLPAIARFAPDAGAGVQLAFEIEP